MILKQPEYDFESDKTIIDGLSDSDRERFISMAGEEAKNERRGKWS